MLSVLLTSGLAKVTEHETKKGYFLITSQNLYEIAVMKAERDYYRDELEKALNKKNIAINLGIGTAKGVYTEAEYKIDL